MGTVDKSGNRRETQELSPLELWDHIENPPLDRDMNSSEKPGEDWNGNISWKKAKDLARNGWPEGLERVAPVLAMVDELVAHAVPGPVTSYDVTGDAPDVGAYLAGIPENMLTSEIQEGASKMVRILVNLGASCGVSPKSIEARGIIACALVDALERVGYRCEVVALCSQATSSPRKGEANLYYDFRTVLKRSEEPLSLDRLTFALIHPAFYRRVMFRWMELIPDAKDRACYHWGYGRPSSVIGRPRDVVVTEMYGHGDDWTPEILAAEVGRYLKEVGVTMDPVGVEA